MFQSHVNGIVYNGLHYQPNCLHRCCSCKHTHRLLRAILTLAAHEKCLLDKVRVELKVASGEHGVNLKICTKVHLSYC